MPESEYVVSVEEKEDKDPLKQNSAQCDRVEIRIHW